MTEKMSRVLEEYVRRGGCLIIGARTGQKDVNGQCVMKQMPGLLMPLTQSAVKEFTLIGPDDDTVFMNWNGKQVETGVFNDILVSAGADAKVLADYGSSYYAGSPALIETRAGKGKVLHFGGTFTRENMKAFLEYAGILAPFSETIQAPQECEISVKSKNGKEYLFVLNFAKTGQEIILNKMVTDMDTNENVKGAVSLAPYETKVYRIN